MIQPTQTRMAREVAEIPEAAQRFLDGSGAALKAAAQALRQADPVLIATIARGSSDHAATYLKYAIELLAGVPVASVGPSVASVYGRHLRLSGAACIGISQSGKSPDIVAMMESARSTGALTLALTNQADSPMAAAVEHPLALLAGAALASMQARAVVVAVVVVNALLPSPFLLPQARRLRLGSARGALAVALA
mgnify:CR=1 FL=1